MTGHFLCWGGGKTFYILCAFIDLPLYLETFLSALSNDSKLCLMLQVAMWSPKEDANSLKCFTHITENAARLEVEFWRDSSGLNQEGLSSQTPR